MWSYWPQGDETRVTHYIIIINRSIEKTFHTLILKVYI